MVRPPNDRARLEPQRTRPPDRERVVSPAGAGSLTNFETTLPAPQSDLARELLKDPYHFGFLGLGDELREREIQRSLLAHIRDFLLELGVGFALVGSQYHLEVADRTTTCTSSSTT